MNADVHAQAVAHVEHALRDYPSLRGVDPAMYVGIVLSWLQPIRPDRPWTHLRWQAPRGEPVWVGGVVGLHVPAPRVPA